MGFYPLVNEKVSANLEVLMFRPWAYIMQRKSVLHCRELSKNAFGKSSFQVLEHNVNEAKVAIVQD